MGTKLQFSPLSRAVDEKFRAQVPSPIRKKPSALVPSVSGYSCRVVRAIDQWVGVRSGY